MRKRRVGGGGGGGTCRAYVNDEAYLSRSLPLGSTLWIRLNTAMQD